MQWAGNTFELFQESTKNLYGYKERQKMKFDWVNDVEPDYEGCVKGYSCCVSIELYIELEVVNEYQFDYKHKQWYWHITIGYCTYESGIESTSVKARRQAEKAWGKMLLEMRKLVGDIK